MQAEKREEPRSKKDESFFEQDIYLYPPEGKHFKDPEYASRSLHVVLLDTQCTAGNYISEDLVKRLGMEEEKKCIEDPPDKGFQWPASGRSYHDIVPVAPSGSHYIVEMELLTLNRGRMLPIMPYRQKIRAPEQAKITSMEQSQRQGREQVEAFEKSHGQQSQYPAAPQEGHGRSAQGNYSSVLHLHTASHSAGQQGYLADRQTDHTFQRSQVYEDLPGRQIHPQAQLPISPHPSSGQPYASQQNDTPSYSTDPGRFDENGSREPPYSGAQESSAGIGEPPSSHGDPYPRAHNASAVARDPYPDSRDPSSDTHKSNPGCKHQMTSIPGSGGKLRNGIVGHGLLRIMSI